LPKNRGLFFNSFNVSQPHLYLLMQSNTNVGSHLPTQCSYMNNLGYLKKQRCLCIDTNQSLGILVIQRRVAVTCQRRETYSFKAHFMSVSGYGIWKKAIMC